MANAMEPATPSSVMGDSEALIRAEGAEKDAGNNPLLAHGNNPLLAYTQNDISDVLLASLYPLPKGYDMHPKNRPARRKNRALLRDQSRLSVSALYRHAGVPAGDLAAATSITEFRI